MIHRLLYRPHLMLLLVPILLTSIFGCGSGVAPVIFSPSVPVIVNQPTDETVPLGSSAQFEVTATGNSSLSYQWQRNNANIAGATSSVFAIQSTSAADNQATFDVIVSSGSAQVQSRSALLTIGPRSPATGDMRFQQVGAASTVNGYPVLLLTNLLGGGGLSQADGFGAPLSIGPSCGPSSAPSIFNCGWIINTYGLSASAPVLSVSYQSSNYSDLQIALANLSNGSIVITGMDLEPVDNALAFSWMQQANGSPFAGALLTVSPSNLQSAITAEGVLGNVVTAISYDSGGQISFMSYSWQNNAGVEYDSEVLISTLDNAGATASTLASSGYVLTAIGGNEYTGVILVGTRVKGDSLPRQVLILPGGQSPDPTALAAGGYATVGILYSATSGFVDWIGEK